MEIIYHLRVVGVNSVNKLKKSDSNLYITVHASILSIFITIAVALFVYNEGIIFNSENSVIDEAEKINKINFIRSVYYPNEGFGDWANNVSKSLKYERVELLQIEVKEEKNISELSPLSSPEDIIEYFRYLHFLADPFPLEEESRYSIGNKKYIPQNAANRGEEILRVINILGHCNLFTELPFNTDGAFKKEMLIKKYFGNVAEVRKWLSELLIFVYEAKKFRYSIYLSPENDYLKALEARDNSLIVKWESSRILRTFGNIRPEKIYMDFLANLEQVDNVADSTQYQITKLDKLREYLPSKTVYLVLYSLVVIVFICSVILPMVVSNLSIFYYIYVPVVFYIGLFVYGFFKLI